MLLKAGERHVNPSGVFCKLCKPDAHISVYHDVAKAWRLKPLSATRTYTAVHVDDRGGRLNTTSCLAYTRKHIEWKAASRASIDDGQNPHQIVSEAPLPLQSSAAARLQT